MCSLVPLCLCAAVLFREFGAELERTQRQSLDEVVRSFGMSLLGRLGTADDELKVITTKAGTTDEIAREEIAKLAWVRKLASPAPQSSALPDDESLPLPDVRQEQALQRNASVVLWSTEQRGGPRIYVVRVLPSGARVYAQIDSTWMWEGAGEFAGGAGLLVTDNRGSTLAAAGSLPSALMRETAGALAEIPQGWMARSWEVFLASGYSSPSWRVTALHERSLLLTGHNDTYLFLCASILLTILLITWASMVSIRRQLRPLELLTQATRRIALRDFAAFRGMSWNDEFGDLARSFDSMAEKLQAQFAALETLSEVDRLMLHTPELELILDALLPRIADVLACESVSVLLFDPDSDENARAFAYRAATQPRVLIRRIAVDVSRLREALGPPGAPVIPIDGAWLVPGILDSARPGAAARLFALRPEDVCAGVLCIEYTDENLAMVDAGVGALDFAARLSLILVSLQQIDTLRRQANFDSLTGLQNRNLFSSCVAQAVRQSHERRGMGGLLYLDLDHFKRVNDSAGHAAGDGMLRIVAERLAHCAGEGNSIARLGGDEFAVLLPSIEEPDSVRQIAERVIASLRQPIVVEGRVHQVSASVGMAVFPADGTSLDDLLKAGDIAMYQAKESGRNRAVFYQSEMQQKLLNRLALESGMRHALAHEKFILHYQPIVCDAAREIMGVEALVRWPTDDATTPWISPAAFIPIAEENGLIVELGEWILRRSCRQFAIWRDSGCRLDYVSVNVSVRQFKEPGYLDTVLEALRDSGMQGRNLQIEITESVLAHGSELKQILDGIAELGVRLALDDFGTGYSSLSYLRSYPIHTVKIDRSFVLGLPHDQDACRLAESIIAMCFALGKTVVAEGVETIAQRDFLLNAGCRTIQGYLLGRPMDPADVPGFVHRLRASAADAGSSGPALQLPGAVQGR